MGAAQDEFLRTKGFQVTISEGGATGKGENENWLSCSGGGDVIEVAQTTLGSDKHKTFAPGQCTVSPLVLEGYLTKDRQAMLKWIKATADGDPARRTVTVTPHNPDDSATKTHTYSMCLIEEYCYPELSSHDHNTLKEKVTIRPEKHECT